ncbi:VWA domain-containing protein [Candidatus Woesearchaeota archaeon]|nr:VWA domain-containing protein [Candidatus Woesearchaeota archaeon]
MSLKRVVYFDTPAKLQDIKPIEELTGKLDRNPSAEDKLMHSVLENDKKVIKEGMMIQEALNQGLNSFTPDIMFQQITKNYQTAKQIYGESLLKLISGFNPEYIQKNLKIPEFRRELKDRIERNVEDLKNSGLIGSENDISDEGIRLASLVTYFEELDRISPKGISGEKIHKLASIYGAKEDSRHFKKGDRYKDIAIKKSAKLAIRRGHRALNKKDLQVHERQSKGQNCIIYALDASGSMRGNKIGACKRAGIALAYRAINEKDKVGLIVFGSEIKEAIEPTQDFAMLIKEIAKAKASRQTDLASTLQKSIELFPRHKVTKHLILLTDAMPNIGKDPEKDTIEQVSIARDHGITISVIGINLDSNGKKLAEKIAEIGQGRLYVLKDTENVDQIVLEDYYSI